MCRLYHHQGTTNRTWVYSGLIEDIPGWAITRFVHCYHHDQFRPKSGSGDQNKHIVPLVETVGWTATEVIAFVLHQILLLNNVFFLWDPTSYNSGRDDVNF